MYIWFLVNFPAKSRPIEVFSLEWVRKIKGVSCCNMNVWMYLYENKEYCMWTYLYENKEYCTWTYLYKNMEYCMYEGGSKFCSNTCSFPAQNISFFPSFFWFGQQFVNRRARRMISSQKLRAIWDSPRSAENLRRLHSSHDLWSSRLLSLALPYILPPCIYPTYIQEIRNIVYIFSPLSKSWTVNKNVFEVFFFFFTLFYLFFIIWRKGSYLEVQVFTTSRCSDTRWAQLSQRHRFSCFFWMGEWTRILELALVSPYRAVLSSPSCIFEKTYLKERKKETLWMNYKRCTNVTCVARWGQSPLHEPPFFFFEL